MLKLLWPVYLSNKLAKKRKSPILRTSRPWHSVDDIRSDRGSITFPRRRSILRLKGWGLSAPSSNPSGLLTAIHTSTLIEALARDMGSLSEEDQIYLQFALGKVNADLGQHDRSFSHLIEGNALKRKQIVYDEVATLGQIKRMRELFTAEAMRKGSRRRTDHADVSRSRSAARSCVSGRDRFCFTGQRAAPVEGDEMIPALSGTPPAGCAC